MNVPYHQAKVFEFATLRITAETRSNTGAIECCDSLTLAVDRRREEGPPSTKQPPQHSSSWHVKMWEILLGLRTIGVAIKFVLLRTREREVDYERLESEHGVMMSDYHAAHDGTQGEFICL